MSSRQHSRRLARQMTLSGDSSTSYPASSSHRSLSRVFGRALSTTLTLNSAEGSCSTILLEDWKPIFDKFDREIDGKQVRLYVFGASQKTTIYIHKIIVLQNCINLDLYRMEKSL